MPPYLFVYFLPNMETEMYINKRTGHPESLMRVLYSLLRFISHLSRKGLSKLLRKFSFTTLRDLQRISDSVFKYNLFFLSFATRMLFQTKHCIQHLLEPDLQTHSLAKAFWPY